MRLLRLNYIYLVPVTFHFTLGLWHFYCHWTAALQHVFCDVCKLVYLLSH